jgi:hypothetical protein
MPGEEVTSYHDQRAALFKVDIGSYGSKAYRVSSTGTVSLLAGDPLLEYDEEPGARNRAEDLEALQDEWDQGRWDLLRRSQGTFSAAHYRPAAGVLTLIADKLGVRLLYYWTGQDFIIFASCLRILEAVPDVPKVMDLRAVTEIIGFGYPLGNRTPYQNIYALRSAEIVQISAEGISSNRYWAWDKVQQCSVMKPEFVTNAYQRFIVAVSRRLGGDSTTLAFLSGGADSRCVVGALRALGTKVHTFNFAATGTQDQVFAAEFAQRAGTFHQELELEFTDPGFFELVSNAWRTSRARQQYPPERPMLGWSGDGGSVGLGHVYMSSESVERFRRLSLNAAIRYFLQEQNKHVLSRILSHDVAESVRDVLVQGMSDEIEQLETDDPARRLYLFLLLNDQRRHLFRHLENVDLHRFEFHFPFFDSGFIETILAVPLDACVGHKFYHEWMKLFDSSVTSVPWQTYPGHETCPLTVPSYLKYQWTRSGPHSAFRKKELLNRASEMFRGGQSSCELLNLRSIRFAQIVYRMGLKDLGYLLEGALTYYRYWIAGKDKRYSSCAE